VSDASPVVAEPAVRPDPRSGEPGALRPEDLLARLIRAIEAARTLGIPVDRAEAVRTDAAARLGFPADVYVLALVGGTGVGKSSLLNALAGEAVSPVSVRRPTTDEPVAWVPRDARRDMDELLAWLNVRQIREHGSAGPGGGVAILDLPDIDSIEATHRERVEDLLPRVDAVVWVTDPEKYHDAVLHDDFLHHWIQRLDRQAIVLNKSDRLGPDAVPKVRRDLERDLATRFAVSGREHPPVIVASAIDGAAELTELRGWLAAQIEAKRIVRDRLVATLGATLNGLAREAGVDLTTAPEPFLGPGPRRAVMKGVTDAVLRAVDLAALERQAVAATRALARARGAGPMGLVTSTIYRLSGRQARVADPDRRRSDRRSPRPSSRPTCDAAWSERWTEQSPARSGPCLPAGSGRSSACSRLWPPGQSGCRSHGSSCGSSPGRRSARSTFRCWDSSRCRSPPWSWRWPSGMPSPESWACTPAGSVDAGRLVCAGTSRPPFSVR